MRVTHGDRQCVCGVLALRVGLRQQYTDHHADLGLLAVAGADHRLLHDIGRIFGNRQPGFGGYEHGDAACLAEFQGCCRICIDESCLDCRFMRLILLDHRDQTVMNCEQPHAEIGAIAGFQRTASDVDQPVAVGFYQAPAGAAEPRIDAENANRMPGHGPVDSPASYILHPDRSSYECHSPPCNGQRDTGRYVRAMPGSSPSHRAKRRAVIVGGSMSGLFSAAFLRQIGWDVDVYERSSVELVGRGAGITGHPELLETLEASGAGTTDLGIEVPKRIAIDRAGRITDERPLRQILTSWDRLQRLLRATIDEARYHLGWNFERVDQDEHGVRVQFSGGRVEQADILVGGDGIRSSVRAQMAPDVQPVYAGYYIWRGAPNEADLAPETLRTIYPLFTFYLPKEQQVITYPISGFDNDLRSGKRRFNFIWYRVADAAKLRDMNVDETGVQHEYSVPPPLIRKDLIADMYKDAREILPPALLDALMKIKQPFITPIYDFTAPAIVFGRVAMIGDAAANARPHMGFGMAKAGTDAQALAKHLRDHDDVDTALKAYNAERQPIGNNIVLHGRKLGTHLGVNLKTEEDRRMHDLLQSDGAMLDWIAVPNFLDAYK